MVLMKQSTKVGFVLNGTMLVVLFCEASLNGSDET
jgi:hypothetical protein